MGWYDKMEDTDELNLSSHVPDGGGTWTQVTYTNGTAKIDTAQKFAGNSSARFYLSGTNPFLYMRCSITGVMADTFYWRVRWDNIGNNHLVQGILGTAAEKWGPTWYIYGASGTLYYGSGVSYITTGKNLSINTWYELKAEFNCTTKTYLLWIKGGTYADWTLAWGSVTWKAFYNSLDDFSGGITRVGIRTFLNGGTGTKNSWWDDLSFGEIGAHDAYLKVDGTAWAGDNIATKIDGEVFT